MSPSPAGRRTGVADLPLHHGRAPAWLFQRMRRLAPAVIEAISQDHGPDAVLRRLSDPHWFQAFGCVLGFDWHASGLTTVVCGALKLGLAGREADTGVFVAGGKGATSRRAPAELAEFATRNGLDGDRLAYLSRMTAKVDNTAVQDGFQLYHHSFFVTNGGAWAVVQQGMRQEGTAARRYHWLGERVQALTREPHAAVASNAPPTGVLNLVAAESEAARHAIADLGRAAPEPTLREAGRLCRSLGVDTGQTELFGSPARRAMGPPAVLPQPPGLEQGPAPQRLVMPARHWIDVRRDLDPRRLASTLISTHQAQPADFEALLALRGVGPKALRALALLAEVTYGAAASTRDPARFSFAHGGKDGHPYPVDRETYDRSVAWLETALHRARLGHADRLDALRRLARWRGI
jgi:uncharacterized protein